MDKETVFRKLVEIGIVPVVRADTDGEAFRAIGALMAGGIPVAEITMTIPGAMKIIEKCCKTYGDQLILGAGTVTDPEECRHAMDRGSQFVVTPTVKTDVIKVCRERAVCIIGGALTPTEILTVWEAGADAVKIFPAKAMGGPNYIRMIHEPLPSIPLVPTGGVNLDTVEQYIKAGAKFVGTGGDLIGKNLGEAHSTELIRDRAKEYIARVNRARREVESPN